jgi:Ca-activated chloride channel homolog
MFSNAGLFCCLIILSGFLSLPTTTCARQIDEGIRFDVPAGGQVRVENSFGNVTAEVWTKGYVSVSVTIAGGLRLTRSPILAENRGKLLAISVVRSQLDPVTPIDITIKLPQSCGLELVTISGSISLRGLSTSAVLKSGSGDIRALLPGQIDASIDARAPRGAIRTTLAAAASPDGHVLEARFGKADKSLTLRTDSGQILLATDSESEEAASAKPTRPELLGPNNASRGAGLPEDDSQTGELTEGDIIRVDSQLVTLNVSVIDRGTNRGLVGLDQSAFSLFEDGQEQRIVQFESSEAPFDLVLLIDLSGSTKDSVKLIREAAVRFTNAARVSDRIAIITFAGEAALVSGFTSDRVMLRQRIGAFDTARGDTKLYDATEFAINEVMRDAKKSRRTAIVLMSDGLDGTIPGVSGQTGSLLPYEEILRRIQEFDGVFYSLWLNTRYVALNPEDTQPEAFDEGHDRMNAMAEAGGGMFYEVKRLEDLAGAYEQVVADLGTVYSLAYRPSNKSRDGKWRAIRIGIDRSNAVARGKRGYYAN